MAFKIRNPFHWEASKKAAAKTTPKLHTVTVDNKLAQIFAKFFQGWSTPTVDQKKLIEMSYRRNADVFSVIGLITNRASQLPWTVYELKDKADAVKAKTEYEAYSKQGDIQNAIRTKARYYVESKNKDLIALMQKPNKIQTMPLFVKEALGYKLLTGNRYLYKMKPFAMKTASQLIILPTHFITIKFKDKPNFLERHNVFYVFDTDFNMDFTTEEVYHSKDWNPYMDLFEAPYGFSPIQAAKNLIEKSNDSYAASAYAYKNMGIAGFISQGSVGTGGGDDQFLTPDEAKLIQDKFDLDVAGVEKFKKIIATSATVNYTNLALSPVDLAIIDSQKMDREQICNIWNVPVQMMNSQEASTRDNMLTAERAFYLNAVIPEMCDLRDTLNEFVVKDFGEQFYVDFDMKSIPALQADLKTLSERLKEEVGMGTITRDEYREIMDYGVADKKIDPDGIASKLILPNTHNPKVAPESKPPN